MMDRQKNNGSNNIRKAVDEYNLLKAEEMKRKVYHAYDEYHTFKNEWSFLNYKLVMTMQHNEVLRFANDFYKNKEAIRVKSFYTFHTCQLSCFKNLENTNNKECMIDCERDFDDFHRYRKQSVPEGAPYMFYGSKALPEAQRHEYEKQSRTMRIKVSDYIK